MSVWDSVQGGGGKVIDFDKKIYGTIFNPAKWGNVGDSVFSGLTGSNNVNPTSTLTPEQQAYLASLSGKATNNLDNIYGGLNSLAKSGSTYEALSGYNPANSYIKTDYTSRNAYDNTKANYDSPNNYVANNYNNGSSYDTVANWENEFQNGVVNPAMRQMNKNIDASRNTNQLYGRASKAAEDEIRQNTADNIAGQRYSNVMAQQQMKQQGAESQLGRGLSLSQDNASRQQSAGENQATRNLDWLKSRSSLLQQANENQYNRDFQNAQDNASRQQVANKDYDSALYQYLTGQQTLKQQGLNDAYARQYQALGGLSNLSGQILGLNGVENIVTQDKGLLDYLGAATTAAALAK